LLEEYFINKNDYHGSELFLLRIDGGGNIGGGSSGGRWGHGQGLMVRGGCGPQTIVKQLSQVAALVQGALIEHVQIFRQLPLPTVFNMQGLLVNMGWWQGLLDSLGVSWRLIKPVSWHSRLKLGKGQNRVKLAAGLWPGAGLLRQADDGLADGLLIAEVCRQDYLALNVG
jgi:hypothetical protein